MTLHTDIIGAGPAWVILHGLFGSGSNWVQTARRLSPDYRLFLLDQCNHGRSLRAPVFDYRTMARDVKETLDAQGVEAVGIIGHSMGGKVAMQCAAMFPSLVTRLVVVDIAPRLYAPRHLQIIDALKRLAVDRDVCRVALDAALSEDIPCPVLRAFLLKSLVRCRAREKGWRWLLGIDEIEANYASILAAPDLPATCWVPSLFVCGGQSDFVSDADESRVLDQFPDALIHRIPSAAHWVHTDAPDAFHQVVASFLAASEH